MKRSRTILAAAMLSAAMIAGMTGCGSKKAASDSKITIGIPQDLDGLDPHKSEGAGTREILFNLYEGLVKPDADGNLNPAVASDYTISEDGRVYTFTLREGVKFHNGQTVTAEDVKYSIDRCAGADGSEPLVAAYSKIEKTEILDPTHVAVTLKEGNTDFLTYMTYGIVPKDAADLNTNPVGTGPYKFVSRTPQENVILQKFEDYWGNAEGKGGNLEEIELKIESNMDALVMDLEGGSIDMFARVPAAQCDQLSDKFEVLEGTMNLVQALYLNDTAVEAFGDVRVRQALCYAIDRQKVLDLVSDGKGTIIGSAMYPSFGKYYLPELTDLYPTDTEKAKQLLTDAGYPNGFEFTITVPSNYPQHVDTAQVLAEQLKTIGVTAKIQQVEWDSWLSDVYSSRNYDATVVGLDASTLNAPALLARYVSTSGKNFMNYSNAEYDRIYAQAEAETDDAKKTEYYKACEKILAEDAANVYIQDLPCFVALNKKYTGYQFYPLYAQDFTTLRLAEQ